MLHLTVHEVEILRNGELETTVFGIAVAIGVTALAVVAVLIFGAFVPIEFEPDLIAFILFVAGMSLSYLGYSGIRAARGHASAAVKMAADRNDAEIKAKQNKLELITETPAAASTPAVADESTIKVTTMGGRVVELPRETVLGFEPSDLKYFCQYVCEGNSLAENRIQSIPLPSGELIGELKPGTPLSRFVDALLETEMLIGRDGKKKLTGTLTVTDPKEMYRRLKEFGRK